MENANKGNSDPQNPNNQNLPKKTDFETTDLKNEPTNQQANQPDAQTQQNLNPEDRSDQNQNRTPREENRSGEHRNPTSETSDWNQNPKNQGKVESDVQTEQTLNQNPEDRSFQEQNSATRSEFDDQESSNATENSLNESQNSSSNKSNRANFDEDDSEIEDQNESPESNL